VLAAVALAGATLLAKVRVRRSYNNCTFGNGSDIRWPSPSFPLQRYESHEIDVATSAV